jgi:SMODS and SLOG-associating 2TM effector domain 3/SMODS and SLOG-associating 2TM effector domain 1
MPAAKWVSAAVPDRVMPETAKQTNLTISDADYPALFLAADSASRMAQKRHLWFTAVILGALVLCAAMGALSGVFPGASWELALASTAWAALSFMVTSIRKTLKPEKIWYSGRAVAESAKTMAWRYMTGADPYPVSLGSEGDLKFVSDLKQMVKDQGQAALALGSEFSDRPQISERMREVRSAPLEVRRQVYVTARIQDQRKWYGAKARKSQKVANWYFVVIQVSQALALAGSVLLLSPRGSKWNLGSVFSAVASALIAWLQVRQHEELAQSYSVAALELGFVEEEAARVSNEKELSSFVAEAENTISSEHSLWITRHK